MAHTLSTYQLGIYQLRMLRARYLHGEPGGLSVYLTGTWDGEPCFVIKHGNRLIQYRTWTRRNLPVQS